MARPPHARDRALQAFIHLVVDGGDRAATIEAVAAKAGISRGGLLYHFRSREALITASLDLLRELAANEVESMRAAPEGAARMYIRTSLFEGTDYDYAIQAAVRLTQSGNDAARTAMREVLEQWRAAIRDDVGDEGVAAAVWNMGEGLYHLAAIGLLPEGEDARQALVAQLLAQVDKLDPR